MLRPGSSQRWFVDAAVVLVVVGALWWRFHVPDVKAMTVAQLVEHAAKEAGSPDRRGGAAHEELRLRARDEVLAALRAMVADPGCAHRELAVGWMQVYLIQERELAGSESRACERLLVAVLAREEGDIAAAALNALSLLLKERREQAPAEILPAVHRMLASSRERDRHAGAFAVWMLGNVLEPALPRLLDLAASEAADPVRGTVARALGEVALENPTVVDALLGLLGDPVAEVREGAATSLGRHTTAGAEVISALRAHLDDPAEEAAVRVASLSALANLVDEVSTAAALIPSALDSLALFPWGSDWVEVLGKLGPAAPHAPETAQLVARMAALSQEGGGFEWGANCVLARIALAAADDVALSTWLPKLEAQLACLAVAEDAEYAWTGEGPLIETLVQLVRAGKAPAVDANLRSVLQRAVLSDAEYRRRWAERQLALLPPQ